MNKKYVLSALCLPAVFAACTNEELISDANTNITEGKEIVDIKVTANYGSDNQTVDSRMINNNGQFHWENSDILGSTLITSDEIYSNNKFTNELTEPAKSAVFSTAATTVVGDYLFYYPYSTDITTNLKGGVAYSLNDPQVYDPTGEEMMKNNFMISPKVIVDGGESGEVSLPLTMRSIYSYGELGLKLDQASTYSEVYVQKVIISYTSNVHKDGKINLSLESFPSVDITAANIEKEMTKDANKGKTEDEVIKALFDEADEKLTAYDEDYSKGTILNLTSGTDEISQVSISCLSDENPNGIKVTKDGGFYSRVLLPTTDTNGTDVTVTVYTNKGETVVVDEVNMRFKPNHTVNLANPNRDADGDKVFEMDGEFTEPTAINAITEADFIQSMKAVKNNIEVTVGDFELTEAAVKAIPSNVTVTFTSDVKFNGNVTLNKMTFKKNVTINGGNVTIPSTAKLTAFQPLTINGGNVIVTGDAGIASAKTILENGVLTITEGITFTSDIAVNGGVLNIGSKAKAEQKNVTTWLNKITAGEVNIYAPFTASENITLGTTDGNNTATLNVNANVTLVQGKTITVNKTGTVNNKAELSIVTNNGTINAEAGKLNVTTSNAAGAVINYNGGDATVETNNGTIKNNVKAVDGTLTVTKNAISGVINVVTASQTDCDTNNGKIFFTPEAYVNIKTGGNGHTETGHLIYTVSEDMTASELKQSFEKCTALLITNGATLNLDEYLTFQDLQVLTLDNGKVNLPEKIGTGTAAKDFVQKVLSFKVFVKGNSEVTGKGSIMWANDNENNVIAVQSNAYFKNSAKLVNFQKLEIEDGSGENGQKTIIENPGTISGVEIETTTLFKNYRWIGNAFVKQGDYSTSYEKM